MTGAETPPVALEPQNGIAMPGRGRTCHQRQGSATGLQCLIGDMSQGPPAIEWDSTVRSLPPTSPPPKHLHYQCHRPNINCVWVTVTCCASTVTFNSNLHFQLCFQLRSIITSLVESPA